LEKHRKDDPLAKPNYQYEKRQKELAKKRKKEEKLKRKQEKRQEETEDTTVQATEKDESGTVAEQK
jgi:hypothetical protein